MKQNTEKPFCDICLKTVPFNNFLWTVKLPHQGSKDGNGNGNCNNVKKMDICMECYTKIQHFIFDMENNNGTYN